MNEFKEKRIHLELKSFLQSISDISFAYSELKNEAMRGNVSISEQNEALLELVNRAITTANLWQRKGKE